jgi:hypothetical protein
MRPGEPLPDRDDSSGPAQAGIGVGDGGSNRLIHFVCQGGSQLSHRCDAADARKVRMRLTQSFFGLPALRNVGGAADELHQISRRIQNRMSNAFGAVLRRHWEEEFGIQLRSPTFH